RTMLTTPNGVGAKVSEMFAGWAGGIDSDPLTGRTSVITLRLVSWPVNVRKLLPSVARLVSELVHATPSMETLSVRGLGVGAGAGTAVNVTLKVPSVITLVPVE